jgi:hypothetical protein
MRGFQSICPPKTNYYRLPWSNNDNPIGWLEVTDACNFHCKGCYRQRLTGHKTLQEIREEVLFLKKWRNCDNISIAGGEPLIHPQIEEVVEFIAGNNMKPILLTNASELSGERLTSLKEKGLAGLTIHIDSLQDRPGWKGKNEAELNELRQQYAELVKREKGLYCSFNSTIYYSNFRYIPRMIEWATKKIDIVDGIIFIAYRGAPVTDEVDYVVGDKSVAVEGALSYTTDEISEIDIMATDIYTIIKNSLSEYEPSGYLGATASHDVYKWFIAALMGSKEQIYGSIGKRTMELFQILHHVLWGTYVAYPDMSRTGPAIFLTALFDAQVRKALRGFLRSALRDPLVLFRRVHTLSVAIIQAPDILSDGRVDMCESCPDMTYYQGKMVNSCRLDEYRQFGGFVSPSVRVQKEMPEKVKEAVTTASAKKS